jgi:hypothetical protein
MCPSYNKFKKRNSEKVIAMVSTMRKFKRQFPASGMQRIEDPLIMQARKRSGHRFDMIMPAA